MNMKHQLLTILADRTCTDAHNLVVAQAKHRNGQTYVHDTVHPSFCQRLTYETTTTRTNVESPRNLHFNTDLGLLYVGDNKYLISLTEFSFDIEVIPTVTRRVAVYMGTHCNIG